MNTYELLYIIPPPYTEKDLPDIQKSINKIIEGVGAKITYQENWGNRKLAYPIKQARRGFYILTHFEAKPEDLKMINSKLKLTPEILRFQIIKLKKTMMKQRKPKKSTSEEKSLSPDLQTLDEKIDKLLDI